MSNQEWAIQRHGRNWEKAKENDKDEQHGSYHKKSKKSVGEPWNRIEYLNVEHIKMLRIWLSYM